MLNKFKVALIFGLVPLISGHAHASEQISEANSLDHSAKGALSSREFHRLGLQATMFDPYPAMTGLSATYNAMSWLQLIGAAGLTGNSSALAFQKVTAATQAFALRSQITVPGWSFSPAVSLGLSHIELSGEAYPPTSITVAYSTAGVSWQTYSGFALNLGLGIPLGNGESRVRALYGSEVHEDGKILGTLPYVSAGWFF